MPICERDPWRFQFFEGVDCPSSVNVPTDDLDSYEWYPDYRWIYEKLNIAKTQGLSCGLSSETPTRFPVFAKPNINLRGMGLGSAVVLTREAFEQLPDDHMWMPVLSGPHISTDCAIVDGQIAWMRHALGHAWTDGMFTHWVIEIGERVELNRFLTDWVRGHMSGYTGFMNFETIGGTMIEAHLRFADQWCDLYGRPWFDALVGLYNNHVWTMAHNPARTGFSIPMFARHGNVPTHPTAKQQAAIRAMPDVSSLQITYFEARPGAAHPMPPGGFRLGLINCWNLKAGLEARDAFAACFSDEVEILKPQL